MLCPWESGTSCFAPLGGGRGAGLPVLPCPRGGGTSHFALYGAGLPVPPLRPPPPPHLPGKDPTAGGSAMGPGATGLYGALGAMGRRGAEGAPWGRVPGGAGHYGMSRGEWVRGGGGEALARHLQVHRGAGMGRGALWGQELWGTGSGWEGTEGCGAGGGRGTAGSGLGSVGFWGRGERYGAGGFGAGAAMGQGAVGPGAVGQDSL